MAMRPSTTSSTQRSNSVHLHAIRTSLFFTMHQLKFMAGVAIAAIAISSCSEDTEGIGNTLTDNSDNLKVSTSIFHATSRTILADSVLTRSSSCYLGRVIDPETQTEVKTDFTTQFHVMESVYISKDNVTKEDGGIIADSCDLILYLSNPFGSADRLTAMQLNMRELASPLNENQRYYSNFDASPLLRTDANAINTSHLFTYDNMTDGDTDRSEQNYLPNIRIPLNKQYISKDGTAYKNYGTYILRKMTEYQTAKGHYPNSYVFAHEICPGFSFEIVDGIGFHAAISNIGLRVFYYVTFPDTAYRASIILAGTHEVMQTVKITNDRTKLSQLAAQTDHTYLKTPSGLFTELTFPIDEIWKEHASDSLLATKMTLQRLHNEQSNERSFGTPGSLLMVMKDSLYTFFEQKQISNSKTSFLTAYNSNYNVYTYSNISSLITQMWRNKQKAINALLVQNPSWSREQAEQSWLNEKDEQGRLKHQDWNKVVLVPVTYGTTSTSTTPVWIGHDLSLCSARLVGGSTPIELSVVYARFSK